MLLSSLRVGTERGSRIENRRVVLRQPRLADWEAWAELRRASREFLVPWEPTWTRDALSRQAFRRRVRVYDAEWRDGTSYSFLVFHREDDSVLGGLTLSNVRRGVAETASLGYWIGARHARQGYMTEALVCALDFAFQRLALHRIEAACLPSNEASKRLLLKVGFTQEGYTRRYLKINGDWRDHLLFAILREDPRPRPQV